jgi:hypothetical protein
MSKAELVAKFKKRGTKDLSKKLDNPKTTKEETAAITEILVGRGVIEAEVKKPVAKKKESPAKKKSANVDVIADFLKVGDTAKIKSKAKSTLGQMVNAEVVKIYACNRTGKDYVRLKADGHTYHKRLNAFAPAE